MLLFSIKPTNEPVNDVINHPDFKMISPLVAQDLISMVKNQGLYIDDWVGCVKLPSYLKKRPLYSRAFRPCGIIYGGLIVFSNDNIGVCPCRDFEANSELILGNAKEITLKEAWFGERLTRLRCDWRRKNKIPNICKICSHYLY